MQKYDVIIIGGGPSGAAASIFLSKGGVKVALLRKEENRPVLGETLIPAGKVLLSELGCWESFEKGSHLPAYGNASVWGSDDVHYTDFIQSPHGLGWHLHRKEFDEGLLKQAAECGVTVLDKSGYRGSQWEGHAWKINFNHGGESHRLKADFVLDGSGRNAVFAKQQGVFKLFQDRLVASVMIMSPYDGISDNDTLSRVEAVEIGWWYSTRLSSGKRLIALFSDSRMPWNKSLRSPDFLEEEFNKTRHLSSLIQDKYEWNSDVNVVDASTSYLNQYFGHQWLAIGDAAQSFDPLSSQGIYHALYSGKIAAEAILNKEGTEIAFQEYDFKMKKIKDKFESSRKIFYHSELRWKNSPFWNREAIEVMV